MAALAEHLRAIGVRELHGMVIEDLTEFLAGADLAATQPMGFDRVQRS